MIFEDANKIFIKQFDFHMGKIKWIIPIVCIILIGFTFFFTELDKSGFYIEFFATLVGAYLGFFFSIEFELLKSKNDEKNRIKYFFLLLNDLIIKIRDQNIEIDKYIENQSADDNVRKLEVKQYISVNISNLFNRLKDIDSRGIYETLIQNELGRTSYIHLYDILDYLEAVYTKEIYRIINEVTVSKAQKDLEKISKICDDISIEFRKINSREKGLLDKGKKIELEKDYCTLSGVTPVNYEMIFKYFEKVRSFFSENTKCVDIVIFSLHGITMYKQIQEDLKFTVKQIEKIRPELEIKLNELEVLINNFDT